MNVPSDEVQPILKCDNIRVSPRGISEVQANREVVFVPVSEIDRLILRFGRSDHRPVVTLAIGLVLSVAGIFGLYQFTVAPAGLRYELGLTAMGVIGASLIFDTLKQRFFFEVHKKRGVRRLVLTKEARKEELQDFCNQVRSVYKYEITDAS